MSKKKNEAVLKARKESAEKRAKIADIIIMVLAGISLAAVAALIVYSYAR